MNLQQQQTYFAQPNGKSSMFWRKRLCLWSVLPLCSYGKVLDFMIKHTRFTEKH